MRNIRTFKEWLKHGEPEPLIKSHIYVEDISGSQKGTKIKELERLLKSHDWTYMYSDDRRYYDKGRDSSDKIHKLVTDIGDDGKKLYKKYSKKYESVNETRTFFPPTPKRLPTEEKHLKKTIIYGQVYNGE